MIIVAMFAGVLIFVAGIIIGTRLDEVLRRLKLANDQIADQLRRKSPLEGKNGLLSYKNLRTIRQNREDDDE